MIEKIKVKLDPGAIAPTRAHPSDAGLDLYSRDEQIVGHFGNVFDTGVHVEIPFGYVGLIKSKSGLNINHGLTCTGVIDAGYTGSVKVKLENNGFSGYPVEVGDKIAQLLIVPIETPEVEIVDEISGGERGDNGFGSTGR